MLLFSSCVIVVYDKEIEEYIYDEEVKNNLGISLVIPVIGFCMNIYDIDNELNDVDYNVELLDTSVIDDNVYFFAGHSGRGDNCYFNRVKELKLKDLVYVYNGGRELIYEVVDSYMIVKNGYMEIDDGECNVLYLITCVDNNRQLIVKCVLLK